MGKNRSRFQGDDNRPVETVSWEEVQMFLDKLNAMEDGKKYRLPTEAEWEYAARAGSTTAYSFGDDSSQLGKYAWFKDNAGNTTHPVGKLGRMPGACTTYMATSGSGCRIIGMAARMLQVLQGLWQIRRGQH
jgi:formylglycine-generating enzyme required for sulfatase activity